MTEQHLSDLLLPLRSGVTIPQIGFGTYALQDPAAAVAQALEIGYRHLDTAQMYANEDGVGEGIRRSGLPRDEVFVTTKLDNGNHLPADALRSMEESLQALGLEHVDLFLIHWPLPTSQDTDYLRAWETLVELKEAGRTRSIGVSNFEPEHLHRISEETGVVPDVNQIEVHPYFANDVVREYCRTQDILVEAWSPLGRGDEFADPVIADLAEAHGVTPAQIILRWHLQRGDIVIPKSDGAERMRSNAAILDFALDADQMSAIDSLDRGEEGRRGAHPNTFAG